MPQKKSPRKLSDFCFQTITEKIDIMINQVRNLPYPLINELYDRNNNLKTKCLELSSRIFLNSCTTNLKFCLRGLKADEYIKRICEICEVNNLTYIDIGFYYRSIEMPLQEKLIQRFHQVQYLNLCSMGSDSILSVISRHCPQLRNLNVSSSEKVTDIGIKSLCLNKEMKIVRLNITNTNVTASGCLHALNNLKLLKIFLHSCWNKLLEIMKMDTYSTQTFPLEDLRDISIETIEKLNIATTVFPNLRRIRISEVYFNDIVAGIKFEKITHLSIYNNTIDINAVGICCPMVQNLRLFAFNFNNVHNNLDVPNHTPFKHLQYIEISCRGDDISRKDLNLLLANCHKLKKLNFIACQSLTDEFFVEILKMNPLYHLKSMSFYNCNFISITSLMMMLEMNNLLNYVQIERCALFSEIEKAQNYIKKNNLNMCVDFIN